MVKEVNLIMKFILERLNNMGKWGGAHTELKNIIKSLPSHFTRSKKGQKLITKAVKQLNNKRFLLAKPSTGEIHVSLNSSMKREIYQFIEKSERIGYKL